MERGFKYRIYPNASQRDQIARTLGCCRFVYNRALDVKIFAAHSEINCIADKKNDSVYPITLSMHQPFTRNLP